MLLDGAEVLQAGKLVNDEVLAFTRSTTPLDVVFEMGFFVWDVRRHRGVRNRLLDRSFRPIGHDAGYRVHRRLRSEVKLHHCHHPRATDSNIRQAIIDRFGGKDAAIGLKNTPGPLYGVRSDVWQALALGLMLFDK